EQERAARVEERRTLHQQQLAQQRNQVPVLQDTVRAKIEQEQARLALLTANVRPRAAAGGGGATGGGGGTGTGGGGGGGRGAAGAGAGGDRGGNRDILEKILAQLNA